MAMTEDWLAGCGPMPSEKSAPTPRLVPDRPSDAAIAKALCSSLAIDYENLPDFVLAHAREIDAAAPPAEAPANLDAAIIREASEVLEAVGASGVALPANWRWPLADELYGMSLLAEAPAERGDVTRVLQFIHDTKPLKDDEKRALLSAIQALSAAPAAPAAVPSGVDDGTRYTLEATGRLAPRVTGGREARLSGAQIEAGWQATFSTTNPFCPCDLRSFTKAVRWAERAALQAATGGGDA